MLELHKVLDCQNIEDLLYLYVKLYHFNIAVIGVRISINKQTFMDTQTELCVNA